MMVNIYPLEWLDSLILETFNPRINNIEMLSNTDLSTISENILKESQKIKIHVKNEVFYLHKKSQIRLLVRKYHSTLVFLMDKIIENQQNHAFKRPAVLNVFDTIIRTLDELISFVENRYSNFLSLDQRVPLTYLSVSTKELLLKLKRIADEKKSDTPVMQILITTLSKSIETSTGNKITYRKILYLKEILKSLENVEVFGGGSAFYSMIDVLLIGMNFNCMEYINHFTGQIAIQLNSKVNITDKMGELLLYYKEFSQLLSNEKMTFDPRLHNIKYVLENWFKHELQYTERKMRLITDHSSDSIENVEDISFKDKNKVECALSTDQLGLILRAGDESRILKAKSMNHVFKTIVPHLSTSQKKDLSYDSMRSKSYIAEERDKEIAIKTLEKIIKHIKEF